MISSSRTSTIYAALLTVALVLVAAPPVLAWSPDGTRVPDAPSILDHRGNVWTLASDGTVLVNGTSAAGQTARAIVWYEGRVYANNGAWYRFEGSFWSYHGTASPIVSSPEGATADGRTSLVDNHRDVWTVADGNRVVRNGVATGAFGAQVLFSADRVYVLNDGWWSRFEGGTAWTRYSTEVPSGGYVAAPAAPAPSAPAPVAPPSPAPAPLPVPGGPGVRAIAADEFVDTVGVNTHFDVVNSTYYRHRDRVRDLLIDSGIRHIREGALGESPWYYELLNTLYARAGIRNLVVVSKWPQIAPMLDLAQDRMPHLDGFEGLNEWDLKGGPNWRQDLRDYQWQLFRAVKDNPRRSWIPVLTPSVTSLEASQALGDMSWAADRGNLHNYYASRHPGTIGWGDNDYGSLKRNMEVGRLISGNLQQWTTETGYGTGFLVNNLAPDHIIARYIPRLLLTQFAAGIGRTYLYQFADDESDEFRSFGLLRSDGSPKPAYNAMRNMLGLLRDPGPWFAPASLNYTIAAPAEVRQMLFQKRDGTYYLALWREVEDYNPNNGYQPPVVETNVTITFADGSWREVTRFPIDDNGYMANYTLPRANQVTVPVSSRMQLLRILP